MQQDSVLAMKTNLPYHDLSFLSALMLSHRRSLVLAYYNLQLWVAENIFSAHWILQTAFFRVRHRITKQVNKNVKLKKHILKTLTFSVYVRAPSVLILGDGMLGSPVPRVFVAIIRNSYSIHGIKSITVADSIFPSISDGSKKKN